MLSCDNENIPEETQTSKPTSSAATPESSVQGKVFQSPKKKAIGKACKRLTENKDNDSRKEEAYNLMKELRDNKRQRDNFDVFGEHVACKIRSLNSPFAQNTVEHIISNTLFEASMGKYDNPGQYYPLMPSRSPYRSTPTGSTYSTTPVPSPSPTEVYVPDKQHIGNTSDLISQALESFNY